MSWIVVTDYLSEQSEGSDEGRGQWGTECGPIAPEKGTEAWQVLVSTMKRRAKLYDDDGELYYMIAFDDAAEEDDEEWGGLYQAYKWAQANAGVTDLRIKGESVYG